MDVRNICYIVAVVLRHFITHLLIGSTLTEQLRCLIKSSVLCVSFPGILNVVARGHVERETLW